jgi:BON domain
MNTIALVFAGLLAASLTAQAQTPPDKKNWFGDPFFQVASSLPTCPVPEGPMLTYDEQRLEAHWRAERGTSCWLAGKCRDANAFRYDQSLAAPVAAALRAVPGADTSSVWVTIQRRWVFLEGCVSSPEQALQLEQAAKAVPEVEVVVPAVMTGTQGKPPYAVAPRNP